MTHNRQNDRFSDKRFRKLLSSCLQAGRPARMIKEGETIMRSFLRYTRVCDNIIRVNGLLGLTNEFFYLVIGRNAAAYIDTGYGFGDLNAFATMDLNASYRG